VKNDGNFNFLIEKFLRHSLFTISYSLYIINVVNEVYFVNYCVRDGNNEREYGSGIYLILWEWMSALRQGRGVYQG
jgi:hypothetical protein